MSETELVPVPISTSINTGIQPAHVASMKQLLGVPDIAAGEVSELVRERLVTEGVGLFRMTGLRPWVEFWEGFFADLKLTRPWLYRVVGSAGTLCVRYVHGTTIPSNHCWGAATDFTISGELTFQGAQLMLKGYEHLYEAVKAYVASKKLTMPYWGAGYPRVDPMHFDAPIEWILAWKREGKL